MNLDHIFAILGSGGTIILGAIMITQSYMTHLREDDQEKRAIENEKYEESNDILNDYKNHNYMLTQDNRVLREENNQFRALLEKHGIQVSPARDGIPEITEIRNSSRSASRKKEGHKKA